VRDHSGVSVDFRATDVERPPARDLLAAMTAEMDALYETAPGGSMPTATAADFRAPGGTFLVGFDGERPVCAGGLKALGHGAAEIKRMYVVPSDRGRGLARALLAALEAAARDLGHRVVRLDTGARQPNAWALYLSAGYTAVDDYNANPHAAHWGEKVL
jgi:GNAT superfamily N-acetyltransferase